MVLDLGLSPIELGHLPLNLAQITARLCLFKENRLLLANRPLAIREHLIQKTRHTLNGDCGNRQDQNLGTRRNTGDPQHTTE